MNRLSEWKCKLQMLVIPVQPRVERLSATGLTALYGLDSTFKSARIKDISTSGIYLLTEGHPPINEQITLILHEERDPKISSELKVSIRARVARQGKDGIGLAFALPPGMDTNLWGALIRNIVTLTEADQIADMFRTLRVILFLCRLCQSGAQESILLLGGKLADQRLHTLFKIALDAEKMLASEPDCERRRADPRLVANILSEGSWTADESVTQLWTGLLVSSCLVDESDDSNQVFVNLLIHIAPDVARIFHFACEQVLRSAGEAEVSPSSSVVVTPEELAGLTSVSELARNASSVAHLFNLGLIRKLPDFCSYKPLERFDLAPTRLGLELYRRCHGKRGKVDEQLVLTADEHLRDIIPQPVACISQ